MLPRRLLLLLLLRSCQIQQPAGAPCARAPLARSRTLHCPWVLRSRTSVNLLHPELARPIDVLEVQLASELAVFLVRDQPLCLGAPKTNLLAAGTLLQE